MGRKKRKNKMKRRRSLRVRIYELRNFILSKINNHNTEGNAKRHMAEVLSYMGDIFDIKTLEHFYHEHQDEISKKDQSKITSSKKTDMDIKKAKFRKMMGWDKGL